jgi:hypothetical protein
MQASFLRPTLSQKELMTETTDVRFRAGFDHATSPELVGASFEGWSRLRAQDPAFRSDIADTYDLWYLLRYADIRAALQDHELFSSRSVQYLGDSPQRMLPEELDPPEHAKYRRLLNAIGRPPPTWPSEPGRTASPAPTWPGLSCGSRSRNGTAAFPTTSWRPTSRSTSTWARSPG